MASPTWFSGIGLREWGTLPNSNYNTAGVIQSGGRELWESWSGAIVNTEGLYVGSTFIAGTFLVHFGGGHTDYGGNELYAYGPLESDSPQCYRLRDRTEPYPENQNEDANGNPVSRHTYSSLAYVNAGGRNWLICAGGLYRYLDGSDFIVPQFHYYDFAVASPNSNQPWSKLTPTITAGGAGNTCAFDGQYLWFHPDAQGVVARVDVINNTGFQRNIHAGDSRNGDAASAFDSTRGIWAVWGATAGIRFFRTNNINNSYYTPTTTGTAPTSATGSILYDEDLDCFVVWTGGTTLYRLTPPATNPYSGGNAWTWSSETPSGGSTPSTKQANGTFGRFNRISSAECQGYILSNDYDESIYFFRTGDVYEEEFGELSGSFSSSSSFSGVVTGQGALSGAFNSASAFNGALSGFGALSGAFSSSSSLSANIEGLGALAGLFTSASSFSGGLSGIGGLSGNFASNSSFAGSMAVFGELVGFFASSSAFSANIEGIGNLSGTFASQAVFSGAMSAFGALVGAFSSSSRFSGSLSENQYGALVGSFVSSSSFAGIISALGDLSGGFAGTSDFTVRIGNQIISKVTINNKQPFLVVLSHKGVGIARLG
jgi:hypothetical protein